MNHRAWNVGQVLVVIFAQVESQIRMSPCHFIAKPEFLKQFNRLFRLLDAFLPADSGEHATRCQTGQKLSPNKRTVVASQLETGFVLRDSFLVRQEALRDLTRSVRVFDRLIGDPAFAEVVGQLSEMRLQIGVIQLLDHVGRLSMNVRPLGAPDRRVDFSADQRVRKAVAFARDGHRDSGPLCYGQLFSDSFFRQFSNVTERAELKFIPHH